MSCPNVSKCPLFTRFKSDSSLGFWKAIYCNSQVKFDACARFQMRQKGQMPGPLMLPNGKALPG